MKKLFLLLLMVTTSLEVLGTQSPLAKEKNYQLTYLSCALDNGVKLYGRSLTKFTNRLEVAADYFGYVRNFEAELIKFSTHESIRSVIVLRAADSVSMPLS